MRNRCRTVVLSPSLRPRMRGYPDGMHGISLWVTLIALGALMALPARADEPAGWTGVGSLPSSVTVLRAVNPQVALAGGFDGVLLRTSDLGRTWNPTTRPSDAGIRDIASTDGTTIFTLDARGVVRRSGDAGGGWTGLKLPGGVQPVALTAFRGGHVLA